MKVTEITPDLYHTWPEIDFKVYRAAFPKRIFLEVILVPEDMFAHTMVAVAINNTNRSGRMTSIAKKWMTVEQEYHVLLAAVPSKSTEMIEELIGIYNEQISH